MTGVQTCALPISVLASVCGGDLDEIKSVIECETADEWARSAAIDSLVLMVGVGLLSRDLVVEYFAELYRGKIARVQRNETVWGLLIASTAILYPGELIEDIEQVFADDLTDGTVLSLEEVREDIAKGKEAVLAELPGSEERRVGKECERLCRSRWSPYH